LNFQTQVGLLIRMSKKVFKRLVTVG
jgi:hypothetical protein